jgi:hypothetical protein
VLVLGFVVAANLGCMKCGANLARKATEKALEGAIEKSTGGKASIDVSGNVDISGIPAFARYPGAKGTAKWSMSGDEGAGTVYSLETADAKDVVTTWYKTSLEGSGWKQLSVVETADATSFTYGSQDEKENVNVTIASGDGKTAITVLYSKKQ